MHCIVDCTYDIPLNQTSIELPYLFLSSFRVTRTLYVSYFNSSNMLNSVNTGRKLKCLLLSQRNLILCSWTWFLLRCFVADIQLCFEYIQVRRLIRSLEIYQLKKVMFVKLWFTKDYVFTRRKTSPSIEFAIVEFPTTIRHISSYSYVRLHSVQSEQKICFLMYHNLFHFLPKREWREQ